MKNAELLQWAVALGVGAVLTQVVQSILQRKKMGADAAKVITEAAAVLLNPLQERVKQLEPLEQRVRDLERMVHDLTTKLHHTEAELASLRLENLRLSRRQDHLDEPDP
jgi:uncharacterized protein YlxW (UPF0749 family)